MLLHAALFLLNPLAQAQDAPILQTFRSRAAQVCRPQLLGELAQHVNKLVDQKAWVEGSMRDECLVLHPDEGPSTKCGTEFADALRTAHGMSFEPGFPKVQMVPTGMDNKCNVVAEVQLSAKPGDEVQFNFDTECREVKENEDHDDASFVGHFRKLNFASMGGLIVCDGATANVLEKNFALVCSPRTAEALLPHVDSTDLGNVREGSWASARLDRAEEALEKTLKSPTTGLGDYDHTGYSHRFTTATNQEDQAMVRALSGESGKASLGSIALRPRTIGFDGYRMLRVFYAKPSSSWLGGSAKPITASVRLVDLYGSESGIHSPTDLAGSVELCAPVKLDPQGRAMKSEASNQPGDSGSAVPAP